MTKNIDGKVYYVKGDGTLVPEDQVRDFDKLRDQFVMAAAEKMLSLRTEMIRAKADIIEDIEAFMEEAGEQHGIQMGGDKGNYTFTSFDGRVRLQYTGNESLRFNEGIYVAKKLIEDYLNDITTGASPAIKKIVASAFKFGQKGADVKAILKLREVNISDERWTKAMEIIDQSKVYVQTPRSLRLYVRSKASGKMELVPLDFSTILGESAPEEEAEKTPEKEPEKEED